MKCHNRRMALVGLHPYQTERLARSLRQVRNSADDLAAELQVAVQLSGLTAPTVAAGLHDLGVASSRAGWVLSDRSQRLTTFGLGLGASRVFVAARRSRPPEPRAGFAPTGGGSIGRKGRYVAPRRKVHHGGDHLYRSSNRSENPLPNLDSRGETTDSRLETTSGEWRAGVQARVLRAQADGQVGMSTAGSRTFRPGGVDVHTSGEAIAGATWSAEVNGDIDLRNRRAVVGGAVSGFAGVEATGTVTAGSGPVTAAATGRVAAGIEGEIGASAIVDLKKGELRAKGGVDVQLAVSASIDTEVALGDSVTAAAEVEAMAGLAFVAHGETNISMDEISASWEVGAALGIGGSFDVDVSFSPEGIVDDIGNIVQDVDLGGLLDRGVDMIPFG